MSTASRSLLDTESLDQSALNSLFSLTDKIAERFRQFQVFYDISRKPMLGAKVVACLFFEPSTRTRMSFEMAANRLGVRVIRFDESSSSSLIKGESVLDTVLNILAMKPNLLVVRYGQQPELDQLWPTLDIPVINGGSGTTAHPTQALLDAYTILKERGRIAGERVLIVGDIVHSRVASSNFDVLKKMGAEVAVCGPQQLLPAKEMNIKTFAQIEEGLAWATVCMGLRMQTERHDKSEVTEAALDENRRLYRIDAAKLREMQRDAIILHPGPINLGVEFTEDVLKDPRCRVLQQVENGVFIRGALLSSRLGFD